MNYYLIPGSFITSFPGLPHSYLPFVFTIIHVSRTAAKNGKGLGAFITWVDARCMDVGGRGLYSNMYVLNLKASFSPVKTSSFGYANVWSPKLQTDDPVPCFGRWVPPPYVHLTST